MAGCHKSRGKYIVTGRVLSFRTDSGVNMAGTWATWGSTFDHETILKKKCQKLNSSHFRVFGHNELFIFAWLIDQEELEEALEYISVGKWIAEDARYVSIPREIAQHDRSN